MQTDWDAADNLDDDQYTLRDSIINHMYLNDLID